MRREGAANKTEKTDAGGRNEILTKYCGLDRRGAWFYSALKTVAAGASTLQAITLLGVSLFGDCCSLGSQFTFTNAVSFLEREIITPLNVMRGTSPLERHGG